MDKELIDLSGGYALNVLPVRSGDKSEWRVRDGFRSVARFSDILTLGNNGTILGAWSAQHPITEETWHYIAVSKRSVQASSPSNVIYIVSEDMSTVVQEFEAGGGSDPRAFTMATVQGMIFISSPDVPTAWGWIGGPLVTAQKLDGINEGTPYTDVPQGLVAGWAGRLVVAAGNVLHFSDPLSPRSFAGDILIGEWSGPVYGLHVTNSGTLVMATEAGVFGISEDAAAAGQFVNGSVFKISDHPTHAYNSTCTSRGRLFGLTRTGVKVLLPESEDVQLQQVDMPRAFSTFQAEDFRRARIIATSRGFIVPLPKSTSFFYFDGELGAGSVFTVRDLTEITAVMRTPEGDDYFIEGASSGDCCVMGGGEEGRFDVGNTHTASEAVYGGFTYQMPISPDGNLVVRELSGQVCGRDRAWLCVNGRGPSGRLANGAAPHTEGLSIPQLAPVVGVDSWTNIVYLNTYVDPGATYRRRRFESVSAQFAERGRSHTIEIFVNKPRSLIRPVVAVEIAGAGKTRRSK